MLSLKTREQKMRLWFFFSLFLLSGMVLSYSPLSVTLKSWVFCCGVLAPLLFLFFRPLGSVPSKKFREEPFEAPTGSVFWIGFVGLALLPRFWRLTETYLWPTGDEALHGFLAMSLADKWTWQFFYTVGEHPPLLIWILALFFKWFDSPFFNLWFLPAFFSFLSVPAGYFLARFFSPKSQAFLFAFLLAFSFWPLSSGRFCHQGLFVPFWELLSFLFLALWMKSPSRSEE